MINGQNSVNVMNPHALLEPDVVSNVDNLSKSGEK